MADDIKLQANLPDFKRQLDAFTLKLQQDMTVQAGRAGARVFQKALRKAAPKLAADINTPKFQRIARLLSRSIYVYHVKSAEPGTVQFKVSFRKKDRKRDPFYGRFLEEGWLPRGPGRALKGGRRTKSVARALAVAQGATKAQHPFIVPTFGREVTNAIAAFNAELEKQIKKETKL